MEAKVLEGNRPGTLGKLVESSRQLKTTARERKQVRQKGNRGQILTKRKGEDIQ